MIIGTCSICGGPVEIPDHWMSVKPPVPTCMNCGATKKNPFGGRIEMEPRKPITKQSPDAWKGMLDKEFRR